MKSQLHLLFLIFLFLPVVTCPADDATEPQSTVTGELPIMGLTVARMSSFDRIIPSLMKKWDIPGGAVAVTKEERLVFARGYGWSDREAHQTVSPDALFRIASLSKPITSAAVLKLVEEGRLRLDAPVFPLLGIEPIQGAPIDSRINDITVRHLLQHTGGWDYKSSFDPMFIPGTAARAVGAPAPAEPTAILRYMLGQPLQFDPGTQHAYSNFGYSVLGRVIEKVSGQSYEDFVQTAILQPSGIKCMRLGRTQLADRAAREVKYYDSAGNASVRSVFPQSQEKVPVPYGGFHLEAMDAHGGWIASAIDLMRFVTAVDDRPNRTDILQPATIAFMISRPAPPLPESSPAFYGAGWNVRTVPGGANWWHTGSLPGTQTLMVRAHGGLSWVALFNSRPVDKDAFSAELDKALWQAVREVTQWPEHDLFGQYEVCSSP